MQNDTYLVTGARGYIGHVLCCRLGKTKHVVGIDNESAPTAPEPPVEYHCHDVRDGMSEFVRDATAVIHLAAVSDVGACEADPERAWSINAEATEALAQECELDGTPLIFASTHAVADRPDTTYATTKLYAESAIRTAARGTLPARILRVPNVHGSYETIGGETVTKGTVIDFFRDRAADGKPLPVHLPGTQTREFIPIEEVVTRYMAAISEASSDALGRSVSTSWITGEERTVLDVAREIATEYDVPIELTEPDGE